MAEDQKISEESQKEPEVEPQTDVPEHEEVQSDNDETETPAEPKQVVTGGTHNKFVGFLKTTKGKIVLAVVGVVVILGVLLGIPTTRYAILGNFIKRDVSVVVLDKVATTPVSEVNVQARNASGVTDNEGKVTINLSVGYNDLTASKKYFTSATQKIEVPLWGKAETIIMLEATGRQVPLTVINKITGKPVANAKVTATDENLIVTTNADGKATMVVPADKTTLAVTIALDGYNTLTAELTVTEQPDAKNDFTVTPSGTVYFLSKRSGKIDVMKSDLDGGNAKVVLAGTGLEDNNNTVLLTSRDWKYSALLSRREGDKPKLYLIDATKGDELSVMDEGNADFQLIGWYDSRLAYVVTRKNVEYWQPKQTAIKSFDAPARKITVIQEDTAEGPNANDYADEWFGNYYLVKEGLVFTKQWSAPFASTARLNGKKIAVVLTGLNGDNKRVLKEFDESQENSLAARLYAPQEVYFKYNPNYTDKAQFFELDGNTFKDAPSASEATFDKEYPTFLISPSGEKSMWSESRDGKQLIYVGDQNAGSPTLAFTGEDDILQFGWYGEDYLLVSKDRSQLFILPRQDATQLFKITDYHRPSFIYEGYGYGYGGY